MSLMFVLALANLSWANTVVSSRVAKLEFASGYPTEATAQKLYDKLDFQRAVQAYLWAILSGAEPRGSFPRSTAGILAGAAASALPCRGS